MHEVIAERAKDLGRVVGQSDEYKALRRARQQIDEAKELKEKLDDLQGVAERLERTTQEGGDPPPEHVEEYERLLGTIQADSRYQQLVAAQTNFDKLMMRVNEQIVDGMRKGAESSIITLS